MNIFGRKKEEDKKAEEVVDEMLEDAKNKVNQEEYPKPMNEEDLMALFSDCSDVELLLMGDEAHNQTAETIDKLMNGDDFFDNIQECISSLHALYIYKKVLKNRDIKNKTIGDFEEEYQKLLEKWGG